jgi:hypothetical protein
MLMKCGKVKHLLQDYLEKSLSGDTDGKVKHHLESCDECRRDLDEMRQYHSIMKSLPPKKAPEGFGLLVHDGIRAADKNKKSSSPEVLRYIKRWRLPLEAAGALAVAATLLILYFPAEMMNRISTGTDRDITVRSSEHGEGISSNASEGMGLKKDAVRDIARRFEKRKNHPEASIPHYQLSLRLASLPQRGRIPESERAPENGKAAGFSFSSKSMDIKEEKRALAASDDNSAASPSSIPVRPPSQEKLNEIRNLVSVLEGRIEAEKGKTSAGGISSMTVLIPGKNYLNFIYQLAKIGPVSDRKKRDYREANEVRITILFDYRD